MISADEKERMIAEETAKVSAILKEHDAQSYLKGASIDGYVRRCFENKSTMLDEFGGWRWHQNVSLHDIQPSIAAIDDIWCSVSGYGMVVIPASLADTFGKMLARLAKEACVINLLLIEKLAPGQQNEEDVVAKGLCGCYECRNRRINAITTIEHPIAVKIRKGASISKAVLQAIGKIRGIDALTLQVWQRFFEQLGQLWTIDREKWGVTFSAAPSSFLRLGHYGENNSCYRFGKEWQHSKGILAQMPRSVAILFYKVEPGDTTPKPSEGRIGIPAGRAWGQMGNIAMPGLLMTNVYKITVERAQAIARLAARELQCVAIDMEWNEYDPNNDVVACGQEEDVYINGDSIVFSNDCKTLATWFINSCNGLKFLIMQKHDEFDEDEDRFSCSQCGDSVYSEETVSCERCFERCCNDCSFYDYAQNMYYGHCCASAEQCSECRKYGSSLSLVEISNDTYACEDCYCVCEGCSESIILKEVVNCDECTEPRCKECSEKHALTHPSPQESFI